MFARFGPTCTELNQKAGDGEGGVNPGDMIPIAVEDEDADPPVQFLLYKWDLEFAERLPLLSGYGYDGTKIQDKEDDPGHHGDKVTDEHEPLPTLVFVHGQPGQRSGRHRPLDAGRPGRHGGPGQAGRRQGPPLEPGRPQRAEHAGSPSCAVQGEAQHVLAATEMAGEVGEITGAVDYQTDIVLTVCVEDWRNAEVRYPADDDVVCYGELVRRLRIEAPQYELVRVLPETVVDVDYLTQELVRTDGGLLIDDRPQLRLLRPSGRTNGTGSRVTPCSSAPAGSTAHSASGT